jgi:hypothetical protein
MRYTLASALLWLAPLIAAVAVVVSDGGGSIEFLVMIAVVGVGLGAVKFRVDGMRSQQ